MSFDLDMGRDFRDQFDELGMSVIKLVTEAHADNQQSTQGASLVRSLSALLASGQAHAISGDDPTRPPFISNEEGEGLANDMLSSKTRGSDGTLRPGGPTIGTVVIVKGKRVILFDQMTAFAKAQSAFPTLIQHGQGTGSCWASVWEEGLGSKHMTRTKNPNGRYQNTYRAGVGPAPSRESSWRLKRSLKARTPTSNRGTGAGSRLPHWAVFRSRPAERA